MNKWPRWWKRGERGATATTGYLTRQRVLLLLTILVSSLGLATLMALAIGSEEIASHRLLGALSSAILGLPSGLSREEETILFQIRLPRVALAIGVGAALALSGAAFQSLLRNPLADPY
ncbi:MAG: iron chelate uptake ABC transporter family permease subunit, partial [bacterium]